MLYDNLSRPEAIYFRMKKFYYVTTYKGVFHQNPDYAHWYGNAPLKLALSELHSEALRLRRLAALEKRLARGSPNEPRGAKASDSLEEALRRLRKKYRDGALDESAYEAQKRRLLDEADL